MEVFGSCLSPIDVRIALLFSLIPCIRSFIEDLEEVLFSRICFINIGSFYLVLRGGLPTGEMMWLCFASISSLYLKLAFFTGVWRLTVFI